MMPSDKFELSDTSSGSKEREGDRDRERDKNGSKSKTNAGQTKSAWPSRRPLLGKNFRLTHLVVGKDVSHVPCKFFRLSQCTAGASCPFSHQMAEPGQQKDTCQWFLKGNCKFGHKCALAHVLPGQPMSMDRKNKKAAQQAIAAATGTTPTAITTASSSKRSAGTNDKRKTAGAKEESLRIGIARGLGRGSAPISISKATLSPSAPAPPLSDTDFPFGLPDDFTPQVVQTSTAIKQHESQKSVDTSPAPSNPLSLADVVVTPPRLESARQASSTPSQQDTLTEDGNPLPLSKPSISRGFSRQNGSGDFGFGPIGSPPRSSPAHTPTSQPIPQSIHKINELSPSVSPKTSGLITSPMPASSPLSKNAFMSYSLDLDTSASTQIRTAGTRPPVITGAMSVGGITGWGISDSAVAGTVEEDDFEEFLPSSLNELLTDEEKKRRLSRTGGQRPVMETHHRYSRSVPAVNLMDGVKGIWSDNNGDLQSNVGLSPSFLGSSNVSSGFLPRRTPVGARTFAEAPPALSASSTHLNFSSSGSPLATGFISPPLPNIFSSQRTTTIAQPQSATGSLDLLQPRPIPAANQELYGGNPLSPTVRALQEHAPGQSLPQGLAAGLSRLHIRPSASIVSGASPHLSTLSGSPGARLMGGSSFTSNHNEYTGLTGLSQTTSANPVLGSLDSRSNNINIPNRRQWPSLSMKSPLTSAVIPNDDGLFEMDEDK